MSVPQQAVISCYLHYCQDNEDGWLTEEPLTSFLPGEYNWGCLWAQESVVLGGLLLVMTAVKQFPVFEYNSFALLISTDLFISQYPWTISKELTESCEIYGEVNNK